MVQGLKTKIVPLSQIQVSRSRLRRKNLAVLRETMQKIRKYGQQRPLIIGPDCHLLADTASYLALKAARYDLVKVFQVKDTSPTAVRAVGRLLNCYESVSGVVAEFNSALASLDNIPELDVQNLVLELLPVVIAGTGALSLRTSSTLVSDAGDRIPLKR